MDPNLILTGTFALLFRAFVAQPFTIPSASMVPALEPGDYVWASKFSYGYSSFSLPLGEMLPAFTFAKAAPRRGDVVIFRLPSDPSVNYVMRVIGLPGDTVRLMDGVAYLNGTALARTELGTYQGGVSDYRGLRLHEETLPDGRRYPVLEMMANGFGDDTRLFEVPPGHYFVMGDNRDNSNDSRFNVGYVPEANIIAKVLVAITWPDGKFTMREVK